MSKETERRNSSTHVCYTSPYEFTKTGLNGQQRVSMLQNELQILPEIGKPHRRGHKLPPPGFTYGIQIAQRNSSVAEAMCYQPEKGHVDNSDFKLVRDYAAFNKAALQAGMLTARDQSRFRTVHDIQKKIFRRDASRTKKTNALSNDMVFGTTYKPSTPIKEVIQHHYAAKWHETIQDKRPILKKGKSPRNTLKGKYHTKASLFRHVEIPVEPKPLRKMSDFVNVEHQVDSFRSEAERRKAVVSFAYDSIPRQGTYHTGIYNVPRTTIKT